MKLKAVVLGVAVALVGASVGVCRASGWQGEASDDRRGLQADDLGDLDGHARR